MSVHHSTYVKNFNNSVKDKTLILEFEDSLTYIKNILQKKVESKEILLKEIEKFVVEILKINSILEEMSSRILMNYMMPYEIKQQSYAELLVELNRKHNLNIDPLICLRMLRNKISHVVFPSSVTKDFLAGSKNVSIKLFINDLIETSNKIKKIFYLNKNKNNLIENNLIAQNPYGLKL